MVKIKYSADMMKLMSMFETVTRAKLKDFFLIEEVLFFVVEPGQIGKAIGKKGVNIQNIKKYFKGKEFRIVEFNGNLIQFIKNLFYPIKIHQAELKDEIITIKASDLKTRGLLIGRGAKNLRNYEQVVNRYFKLKEIKVV